MTFINLSPKFKYGLCQPNGNKDDRQNDHRLSVFAVVDPCGHSIFNDFFPFSYMDYFHQLFRLSVNMGFLQRVITKLPEEMIAVCQLQLWVLVCTLTR